MSGPAAEVVPFETLHQPLSPLFLDYLAGQPRVAPFLGEAGFDLDAIAAAADRTAAHARPREAVAAALARQQKDRGAEGAASRARDIADPDAVTVVTGQQAGLFGGPLFVLHKAIATLEIARRLAERRRRPVIPVFWVAADDHDFAEVRSVWVLDGDGAIRHLRYAPRHEPVGQPAFTIVLDETVAGLVDDLGKALAPSPSRDEMLGQVGECYQAGTTLSGAFARLLSRLLPDLVILDSSDPELKAAASSVLTREVEEASPTSRLALDAGRALLEAGYHQQVPVRTGFLNLFVLAEGERRALGFDADGIEIRGLGKRISVEEALRRIRTEPGPWSPNALLRPLVQDAMLPTAAYVGGPAEVAYHAQIGPVYAHFGVPRPVIVPRPSVTIIEPGPARALEKEGLCLPDLARDPEALLSQWAQQSYPEVEAAFARTRGSLEQEMGVVEEQLSGLDPTLRAAAAAARGRALHQVERLHEKAMRALKKRDQGRAARLRRTRDALFPGGALQERGLGLLGLVARLGPGLLGELQERVDPFARGHQVVRL